MNSLEIMTHIRNYETNRRQTEERKEELEQLIEKTKTDIMIQTNKGNIEKAEKIKSFLDGLEEAKRIILLS